MNINWLAIVWLSLILFFYILYSQSQTCPAGDWLVFVLQTNIIQKCYGETTLILSSFYIFIIINSLGFFFILFLVVLQADQRLYKSQTSVQTFTEFMLIVEPRDPLPPTQDPLSLSTFSPALNVGTFQVNLN